MIRLKTLLVERRLQSIAKITDAVKIKLAQAAQKQYDAWQLNDEGYDEEVGTGGICHLIADDLADALSAAGIECQTVSSNFEQHVYLVGKFREGVFMIDIPYHIYETGGGYNWKKIPDVQFDASHIKISGLDNNPKNFDQYVDQYD